ncbi:hypothetical protein GC176_08105 [bacterium]|nr:hypothetical protein [bacterium]
MAAARLWGTIVVLSTASLAVLWLTEIPLGISGEWTWSRIPTDLFAADVLFALVETAIVGTLLLLIAWAGLRRVGGCSRRELAAWLSGLTVIGFVWLSTVQSTPPVPWDNGKVPFVLYYPGVSGYFHKARYEIDDAGRFLSGYEDLMAQGDVLHVGTHPPGLFLLYRGLLRVTEASPALCDLAAATMSDSVQESFATVESNIRFRGLGLSRSDRATIWLAALLTQLACAATVIPLFALIRLTASREAAWQAIAFWPLLPALAIFLPKSDVLFTLPAASLLATWLFAVQKRSLVSGAIAGIIGWGSLLLSLAFLPIGLIAVLCGAVSARTGSLIDNERGTASTSIDPPSITLASLAQILLRPAIGGTLAFVALTLGFAVVAEINLGRVWVLNYQNHAAFYSQFERTWWKWLLVNPVELAFACGLPVAVLCVSAVRRSIVNRDEPKRRLQTLCAVGVWGLLWLSSKNSGEAARLWIPLLPVLLWQLASRFDVSVSASAAETSPHGLSRRSWLILLTLQLAVATLTVLRVSGFHFEAGAVVTSPGN